MSSLLAITNDGAAEVGAFFYALAVVGTVAAVTTSFVSISLHLKHYRRPDLQRLVIRIMFMVPLYAVTSLASLTSRYLAEYVDLFRDVYEAFVVYTFFILMINYLGGERELLTMLQDRMTTHHLWPLHYFLSPIDLSDPKVFLIVRRGVLQFVVLKPILAVFILIMKLMGFYHEGLIRFDSAYVYVSLFYNVSVCVAMYCLVIFYLQCSKDLEAYRPLPKFICVKAIIFFSFWQGFIVAVLVGFDIIHDKGDYPAQAIAVAIQDGLICIESVIFAIGHAYAYPWTDYGTSHRLASRVVVIYALKDVLGTRDIIQDIIQTFSG
ncbi:organic solute transporter subunit alpha/Transmembrane protein, partial [Polychytrium aggregatum]|uniref:organic solute transporter subunit alpha/Transmembrane protein n=1 Tax=Polychytrium aggregatum TaxID=110093 RepID=UPI0022FE4249